MKNLILILLMAACSPTHFAPKELPKVKHLDKFKPKTATKDAPGEHPFPSITLTWDPLPDTETFVGYKLYSGRFTRNYDTSYVVPGKDIIYQITNLNYDTDYYFAAVSYGEVGESDFSNEVAYNTGHIPIPEAPLEPTISNLVVNPDGSISLTVGAGRPGVTYILQASSDLGTWRDVRTFVFENENSSIDLTAPKLEDESRLFIRISWQETQGFKP